MSAAIRNHEPDEVQALISRHSIMYDVSHMDAISFDTQAVCRFFHTCIHCVSGCSCYIHISWDFLVAAAIVCRVL
jgi:hypothetical protein